MIRPTQRASSERQPAGPTVTRRGDVVLLDVGEQLVIRGRQDLRDAVVQQLEKGEKKFVIDFSRTGYIDSAGLGVLIAISKQVNAQGGELVLSNLNEDLRSLMQLTKLDTLFGIIEPPAAEGSGTPGAPVTLHPKGGEGPSGRGLPS